MKFIATLAVMLLVFQTGIAQKLESNLSESTMTISGTSTLHDWESAVEEFKATCTLREGDIQNASFEAKVESIKSGTKAMDQNTYKAMKSEQFPKISFSSTSVKSAENHLEVSGKLTIAGTSKTIHMKLNREKWSEETMTVSGSYSLKMSDYGIDPPRAMLGTIRTGDEVTISFNIIFYQ